VLSHKQETISRSRSENNDNRFVTGNTCNRNIPIIKFKHDDNSFRSRFELSDIPYRSHRNRIVRYFDSHSCADTGRSSSDLQSLRREIIPCERSKESILQTDRLIDPFLNIASGVNERAGDCVRFNFSQLTKFCELNESIYLSYLL